MGLSKKEIKMSIAIVIGAVEYFLFGIFLLKDWNPILEIAIICVLAIAGIWTVHSLFKDMENSK